jgi:hypothetical protein
MENIKEANQKFGKIGRTVNQAPTHGLEHDRIWAQWASNIPSRACWKGYDGANTPRWNLEVEPFIV